MAMKGKTESGFAYELPDDAMDNYELLEALTDIEKGDARKIVDAVGLLLGEEQKKALKEHLREKDGRVSTRAMWQEVTDILKGANGKNS